MNSCGLPVESKRFSPQCSHKFSVSSGTQTFFLHSPTHPCRYTRRMPAIDCIFLSAHLTLFGISLPLCLRTSLPSRPSARALRNFCRVNVLQFVSHCKQTNKQTKSQTKILAMHKYKQKMQTQISLYKFKQKYKKYKQNFKQTTHKINNNDLQIAQL